MDEKIKKQTSVTPERSETPTSQIRYLSLYERYSSHCKTAEEKVKTTTSNVRKVRNIRIARPIFLWHERYSLYYKTTGKNQKQQSPRPPCPPSPPSPAVGVRPEGLPPHKFVGGVYPKQRSAEACRSEAEIPLRGASASISKSMLTGKSNGG